MLFCYGNSMDMQAGFECAILELVEYYFPLSLTGNRQQIEGIVIFCKLRLFRKQELLPPSVVIHPFDRVQS